MSTISTTPQSLGPTSPPPDDPYRYGWRYVRVVRPDGTEEFDQIPLTLEDVLHPEEGDFIVQTDSHDSDCLYLKCVFKERLAKNRSARVLSDCRVDWNIPGVRPLGPDIAVFFGVKRYLDWGTFNLAVEGARPALVIEVTSPDTRKNDVGIKVDYYYRARVPLYVIADVSEVGDERRIELFAYRLSPQSYQRVAPNNRGWIWLDPVGLWLGLTREAISGITRLACFDPNTGLEIGDYTAIKRSLDETRAEAEAQSQARTEAEKKLVDERERLAAESRARSEAEKKRDEESRARSEAEKKRDEESRARSEAEQKRDAESRARAKAEQKRDEESRARAKAETKRDAESRARAEAEQKLAAERELAAAAARRQADLEARNRELEARLRALEDPDRTP